MDLQLKQLLDITLRMMKDVYDTRAMLVHALQSEKVMILSEETDPINTILDALEVPEEREDYILGMLYEYLDGNMTHEEILLAMDSQYEGV
ncbi:hypothetical protein IC620_10170 [Hazenella sp. IB182357]|uniref:Uncharacterized protein n=1 Tax=Polycladospora coralii TaxID=2771432 RepID=A0A926RXP4_9BACL|nr:hypothetical protein [Polycladospora coralii]MBD1372721.1 hypothetical protein [Polycladospora coralii]MBS7531112.1 hypothetical protein [Polycladospora coralii]